MIARGSLSPCAKQGYLPVKMGQRGFQLRPVPRIPRRFQVVHHAGSRQPQAVQLPLPLDFLRR